MRHKPFIKYKNLFVIPSLHFRIEFAKLVEEAFYRIYPDVIAVELPDTVRERVIEGVNRIPYLSLITYADTIEPEKVNAIPIDPGDSIINAIRLAIENNISLEFIDLSVRDYKPKMYNLPDDYSLNSIGLKEFYDNISNFFKAKNTRLNSLKKSNFSLEDLLKGNLEEDYSHEKEQEKLNKKEILREKFMAKNIEKLMQLHNRILLVIGMAHWENIKYYLENPDEIKDIKVDTLPFEYVKLYNVKNTDARFLLKELPYHTFKWIDYRKKVLLKNIENIENIGELTNIMDQFNKTNHIRDIILSAKNEYEEEFKEFINLHKLKILFQYSRNLTFAEKKLLPNLFHLIISSKNVVDDDFAWKVMEKATHYPYNDLSKKYETLKLSQNIAIDPNGKYIKLRRYHPYSYKQQKRKFPLKERPEEKYPGEWSDEWEKGKLQTVSYPPEDLLEENYFDFIRKKAMKDLKSKKVKVEEFMSSLKDGIAIKETVRNWGIKRKIYVRNETQIQGKVDTLVLIFDEDDKEIEKYPYKLTWWAEHDQESDMAFYATSPGDYLIGPGISHVEIGGLLSLFPPIYLPSVFNPYLDFLYKECKTKAERLLKASILYSKEKYIVYIAKKPPRKYFYSFAGIKHRTLEYIPLDSFSKDSLNTVKHIHILAGKEKRKVAHNYIFLNK